MGGIIPCMSTCMTFLNKEIEIHSNSSPRKRRKRKPKKSEPRRERMSDRSKTLEDDEEDDLGSK